MSFEPFPVAQNSTLPRRHRLQPARAPLAAPKMPLLGTRRLKPAPTGIGHDSLCKALSGVVLVIRVIVIRVSSPVGIPWIPHVEDGAEHGGPVLMK
jgi:hypothetical protein